jgi:mono/diheme cytochrome c family protein
MDSNLLVRIHTVSVALFLLTYLIKTILIFTSKSMLRKYAAITKVPEMIISVTFLVTGIWLFVLIGGIKVMQIIKLAMVLIAIPVAIVGFKKEKKGLALLSLILITAAYGVSEASRSKPYMPLKTVAANGTNSTFSEGALVYHSNCAFCHGQDGRKMYRNATDLTLSLLNEDAIKQMVREGKGRMPAYITQLQEEQINAVAVFVKGLRPMAPLSNP